MIRMDSPFDKLCPPIIVKIDFLGALAAEWFASYVFCDVSDDVPLGWCITIVASYVIPVLTASTNIFSPTFAPILNPCAIWDGGTVSDSCPKKNNFVVEDCPASFLNCKYSIFWSLVTTERGVMIEEIKPLSSFVNASFLKPSAARENVPKFEFELVIDASAPLIILKWLWKPIANTDTIWTTESFDTLIWLVLHPLR